MLLTDIFQKLNLIALVILLLIRYAQTEKKTPTKQTHSKIVQIPLT